MSPHKISAIGAAALLACQAIFPACGADSPAGGKTSPPPEIPDTIALSDSDQVGPLASDSAAGVSAGQLAILDEALFTATEAATTDELRSLAVEVGGELIGSIPDVRLWQVRFSNQEHDPAKLDQVLAQLTASPLVEHAFPNSVLSAQVAAAGLYPDDGYSWNGKTDDCACSTAWDDPDLHNQVWGQRAIRLPDAWKLTTGSPDLRLAVVDTGFMADHEDFSGRAELRLGEAANPGDHGTHVTGILGATGNNHLGIAGVNWGSKLALYRVDGFQRADGSLVYCEGLSTVAISQVALLRALSEGARAINMSVGFSWYVQSIQCNFLFWKTKPSLLPVYPYDGESGPGYPNAAWLEQQKAAWRPVLQRVKSRNALLVLAAGNNSNPTVRMVDAKWSGGPQALADEFPDNVIVVAAVGDPSNHGYFGDWADQWNALSPSSSVGELIDVAAPGGKILSLKPYQAAGDDRVEYMSGTSMAAPFVTGLASLVWSLRPEMTPAQVKERIVLGARRGGPQVYRRLDPAKPEPVQAFPFHVINAGATLRIIDRPAGCTDADGDGYGTREPSGGVGLSCAHAEPDCNDSDAKVYPGAPEICDGKDNDCNGHMDEENVCRGVLAAAPVSGVVPGRFSTSGGEFSVSVSPLDPHGDLIRQGLTTSSFSFRDITVELLASPGQQVATGRATVTGVYVEPGGAAGEPLAVALLFDSSGSMSDSDPQYRRVDAARVLLRQLGPDDQAALLDFGALEGQTPVTRVLSPLTADRQAWEQGLAQVTSVDGTPLYQAVAEALGYLSAQGAGRRVLVVLSDGQSTEDDPDGLRQQAASLASQRQIFVYAVGLGAELDFSGLEALASGTGGTFAFAEDAQVLAGLYEALGVATTAGRVLVHGQGTFTPPLSQPGRHLVHGVLRTSVGSGRVDTPFDFTVLMVQ